MSDIVVTAGPRSVASTIRFLHRPTGTNHTVPSVIGVKVLDHSLFSPFPSLPSLYALPIFRVRHPSNTVRTTYTSLTSVPHNACEKFHSPSLSLINPVATKSQYKHPKTSPTSSSAHLWRRSHRPNHPF
jgi:hypothetical protein